jgi:hypothetical protein
MGEDNLAKKNIKGEYQELKGRLWKTSEEATVIETNVTKERFDADCRIIIGKEEGNI